VTDDEEVAREHGAGMVPHEGAPPLGRSAIARGPTSRQLNEYVVYYSRTRTHLELDKDAPLPRPVAPLTAGRVIAIPHVGGLHHRCERRAA